MILIDSRNPLSFLSEGVLQYKQIKPFTRHHHQRKSALDYDDNGESLREFMDHRYHDVLEIAGIHDDYNSLNDHLINGELSQWQIESTGSDNPHNHVLAYSEEWLNNHHDKIENSVQVFKDNEPLNMAKDLVFILSITTGFCLVLTVMVFIRKQSQIDMLAIQYEKEKLEYVVQNWIYLKFDNFF